MRARRIAQIGAPLPPRDQRDWIVSTELTAEARITYRQLDYWCRTGLLTPLEDALPGSGQTRRFDQTQVRRAAVLSGLLAAGFSLQLCRDVIALDTGHIDVGPFTLTIRAQQAGDTAA